MKHTRQVNSKIQVLRLCFVLMALSVVGCKIVNSLPGVYLPSPSVPSDGTVIIIKKNNTFSVLSWMDVWGADTLNGHWEVNGNRLTLKPDTIIEAVTQNKDSVLSVVEKNDKIGSDVRIRVLDAADASAIIGTSIYVNDDPTKYFIGVSGDVVIKNVTAIKNIGIKYVSDLNTVALVNPKANDILITLKLYYPPRNHGSIHKDWIIKRKKLIPITDAHSSEYYKFIIFRKKK
jgi:hypothetical protein